MSFIQDILTRLAEQHPTVVDLSLHAFHCGSCDQRHTGLMDIAFDGPLPWSNATPEEREAEFERGEDCMIWRGEHFFVRCVAPIPVHGVEGYWGLGVWPSISRVNFDHWRRLRDDRAAPVADRGPWFSWFCNRVPGYPPTKSIPGLIHTPEPERRCLFEFDADQPDAHPLARDQKNGITVARLHELYAHFGFAPFE